MSLKIKEKLNNLGHGLKIDLVYCVAAASLRYVRKWNKAIIIFFNTQFNWNKRQKIYSP